MKNAIHDSGGESAESVAHNLAFNKWLADNNPYFNHSPLATSEVDYTHEDQIQMG